MVTARRRIKQERGAALFIVVLVILSLTGVAIFAARSASTDVAMAGRYRQEWQTREIARVGLHATLHELARDPTTYVKAMNPLNNVFNGSEGNPCTNQMMKDHGNTGTTIDTGGCFRFAYEGIQYSLRGDLGVSTFQLMEPGNQPASIPGSLGYASIRPNFGVEMTDKVELPWAVPGYTGGDGSNMRFYSVTLTSTGQIVPRSTDVNNDWGALTPNPATAFMASVESARAQVIVGPLPQGL
jgi:hypothetical protein